MSKQVQRKQTQRTKNARRPSGEKRKSVPPTRNLNAVEPGMVVEANEGDLGERDVSEAKVSGVVRGPSSDVEAIVVKKGLVFK